MQPPIGGDFQPILKDGIWKRRFSQCIFGRMNIQQCQPDADASVFLGSPKTEPSSHSYPAEGVDRLDFNGLVFRGNPHRKPWFSPVFYIKYGGFRFPPSSDSMMVKVSCWAPHIRNFIYSEDGICIFFPNSDITNHC